MANNAPFKHIENNEDVPHFVFRHDRLTEKRHVPLEEYRDAWRGYLHDTMDNNKRMDNFISNARSSSSSSIKNTSGRNKETNSTTTVTTNITTTTSTISANVAAPSYKGGESYTQQNIIPLNRYHENESARNGTYIPTQLFRNSRTAEYVNDMNSTAGCNREKGEDKRTRINLSHRAHILVNKNGTLFKDINAAPAILKESVGMENMEHGVCGNGRNIKNGGMIMTNCTNSSSTITNSTAANTSSRSSSKKTIKPYCQSGVLVSNNDVNNRNNVYSSTFRNNAYILNTKTIHPIPQDVNYFAQSRCPQEGTGDVGITNTNNIKNSYSMKERHFVNTAEPPSGGATVKNNNICSVMQHGNGSVKEEKTEYTTTYTKNSLTETPSGYNAEPKRSATSNVSTFIRTPRSPDKGTLANRVNKTDNINGFQRSQNLRKIIRGQNETDKIGSKQIISYILPKNKEIKNNGACIPSHINTVRNERIHPIAAKQIASISLQSPCAYAVPIQALKHIIPNEELQKKSDMETSTCNINSPNAIKKPVFNEFRNGKSKTDNILLGSKFKEKKMSGGTNNCIQSTTSNNTSASVNICKAIVGREQTKKEELLINRSKTQKNNVEADTEQQKKYANYINVDTTIVEENDLLYSCRNKNWKNTNVVFPSVFNYSQQENVIDFSKHFINHATTKEKKEKNEGRQNSKTIHLSCAVPTEPPFVKAAISAHDQQKSTTNANIELTERKNKLPHAQPKENFIMKSRNHQTHVFNNTTNNFTESILNKEEFKRILKERNAPPPKQNTQELARENVKSTTPTFNSSICVSQNVSSLGTSTQQVPVNALKNSEPSGPDRHLLERRTFEVNNKYSLSKNISTKIMNYCKKVDASLPNDKATTIRRDTSANRVKEIDKVPIIYHTTNELDSALVNDTSFLNSKKHITDISCEQNKTRTRNICLRQLLTHQSTLVNTRPEEKYKCVSESIPKTTAETRSTRKNEHTSNSLCPLIKEKPFAAIEKEKRNASVKGGLYTTRYIAQSPQADAIGKRGYWTYRPLKEEPTVPKEKVYSNSGHHGTEFTERIINPRMKSHTATITENTYPIGNGTSDTIQSILQNDQRKELLRGNYSSNNIHSRTLSNRSACTRTAENRKPLARCKTMKHVSKNLTQFLPTAETSLGTHHNNLTQLDNSHANFLSQQPMNTQTLETTEEGIMPFQENWTMDTSTKLIDETPVTKKAVIIGCNYYRDKEHRLYGAANDAYVFSRTLVKYFDFSPSNIIFLSDCFPSESYINEEFDLQKEEREERENLKEAYERMPNHTVRKSREKKNLFSLFKKNDSKIENGGDTREEFDSVKPISGKKQNVDLLSNVVHVNLWPTRTNILKAVNWLVRDSVARGTYVFFFAGKSIQVDNMSGWEGEGYDEAFLCSDPFNDNNEYNIITAVQLKDLLLSIHSKATMTIVLDCSGCQTILDPAGTESSWSYIKGCKQKGIWPITHPTNKVYKAAYDTSILNNESMKKHFCRCRFADLIEVDSTSAMIDPLLQCISSPTIPPKAYCLCAATWEQISVEGFFPVFRFARVNQIKKMKIPDFQKKKKKRTNKNKNKQTAERMGNGKLLLDCNTSKNKKKRNKKKKSFYETKFDISIDIVKTFFSGSQNGKGNASKKRKEKMKKEVSRNKKEIGATEKEKYIDEKEDEEEDDDEIEEDYEMEEDGEDYEEDYTTEEEDEDTYDEDEEEEENEVIVSHGVFTYCLVEAIVEFKEQELKKNILQNSNSEFLPMTLKNLITVVQEKVQNVKNKKLKKLNQKPEFTLHPGSNANINNYFVHYSKNIHFQNGNYNFLGYDMTPYLNVVKAWEQINKNTLKQQKSLTLTTSLNKVARTISMSASNNVIKAETPQQVNRVI